MPGTPLPRRFYQVLSRAMYSLIFWILALLVAVTFESGEKDFKKHPEHSFSYFIMTFPLYCLVMFGSYTLITIGYHMIILRKFYHIYLFIYLIIIILQTTAKMPKMNSWQKLKKLELSWPKKAWNCDFSD